MACLLAIVALIFPRILMIVLWLFTDWFNGVFDNVIIPILGFIFLPIATLWFTVVVHYYNGEWNSVTIVGMVIAVALDLSGMGGGYQSRGRYR